MCMCKHTAYLIEKRNHGDLVKQENGGLIFHTPAIQKSHVVVICDLEKQ